MHSNFHPRSFPFLNFPRPTLILSAVCRTTDQHHSWSHSCFLVMAGLCARYDSNRITCGHITFSAHHTFTWGCGCTDRRASDGIGAQSGPGCRQKVVDKVRAGNFVEMRELLTDNISLLQQLETFHSQCSLHMARDCSDTPTNSFSLPHPIFCWFVSPT